MKDLFTLHIGDSREVLKTLPDNSVDSIVCDPPYGLSFMGKRWDYDVPSVEIWAECLRVLKPGGHLLAFAGTRTQHRMAVRIEDTGFEIRDMIAWVYGSGFPKSHNVGKSIDRESGAKREVVGKVAAGSAPLKRGHVGASGGGLSVGTERSPEYDITEPATEAARQWQGWGTALKPALEPITVARKPLIGTVASNVLKYGTGGINIDASRIPINSEADDPRLGGAGSWKTDKAARNVYEGGFFGDVVASSALGRWPANLIHDGSEEVVNLFPAKAGAAAPVKGTEKSHTGMEGTNCYGEYGRVAGQFHGDIGSAARFFYCAKASKKDRHEGLEVPGPQFKHGTTLRKVENTETKGNTHPTVKPTDLMAYLCRLVTPPGGIVLDPFMGSGSTGKAAIREGFRFIGIDITPEYVDIARARIEHELMRRPDAPDVPEGGWGDEDWDDEEEDEAAGL